MTSENGLIYKFLSKNLPIISIIGIFLAISKYFIGDGTDPNSVFISIIASFLAIVLLIVLLIDTGLYISKRVNENLKKSPLEFIFSSISDIAVIIIVIILALLVYGLIFLLFARYPSEVNLLLVSIELLFGIIVSCVIGAYIGLKINKSQYLGAILVITFLLVLIMEIVFDIPNAPSPILILQPLSFFVWLMPILELTFIITLFKIIFIYSKKKQD